MSQSTLERVKETLVRGISKDDLAPHYFIPVKVATQIPGLFPAECEEQANAFRDFFVTRGSL